MPYKKILLALTGREKETHVVEETMRLKSLSGAALAIVVVNDPGAGKPHMMMDSLHRVTGADVVAELTRMGYGDDARAADIILVDDEHYARAIARISADYDLLIMGHHAKGRLRAFLTDTIDEHVADRVNCPILLVPIR